MKAENLDLAKVAARNFLKAVDKVTVEGRHYTNGKPYKIVIGYTKESAACRRASMDLTRALSEMRKSN